MGNSVNFAIFFVVLTGSWKVRANFALALFRWNWIELRNGDEWLLNPDFRKVTQAKQMLRLRAKSAGGKEGRKKAGGMKRAAAAKSPNFKPHYHTYLVCLVRPVEKPEQSMQHAWLVIRGPQRSMSQLKWPDCFHGRQGPTIQRSSLFLLQLHPVIFYRYEVRMF